MSRRYWFGVAAALAFSAALVVAAGLRMHEAPLPWLDFTYDALVPEQPERPEMPLDMRRRVDQALAELDADRFHEAAEALEATLEEARDLPHGRVEILTWLGLVSRRLGEFHRALGFYRHALTEARMAGDRRYLGTILHNMGTCYTALGEPELALDLLEQAHEARSTAWEKAVTLTAIATLTAQLGDEERALEQLAESLQLRRASLDRSAESRRLGLATTLDRIGSVAKSAGRTELARRAFESARTLLAEGPFEFERAIVESNLGRLLLENGAPGPALPLLESARLALAQQGPRQDWAVALLAKARAHADLGNLALARSETESALRLFEGLREQVPGAYLRSTFLAGHHAFYEQAIQLAMAHHSQEPARGFDLRGLELAERAKARSLLELLRPGVGEDPAALEPPAADRRSAALAQLDRLTHERLSAIRMGASIETLAELEKLLRVQTVTIDELGGEPTEAGFPFSSASYRQMRALLDPETRFLVYSLGEKASFLWLVGLASVSVHRLVSRSEIERLGSEALLSISLSDRPGGRYNRAAAELGALLVPPDVDLPEGGRLVIVPDGILHALPFAALTDSRTGRPFVHRFAVSTVSSISVLARLRQREQRRNRAPGKLVVVADPVYGPSDPRLGSAEPRRPGPHELERLQYSAQEAEAILSRVREGKHLGFTGFEARREVLLEGQLEPFRIVHFGVHGELVEDPPELSSLVFSEIDSAGYPIDGRVYMHEIASLSLPCELVVLSACNSALGKPIRGEGLIGLTRAVFLAGASRALVSLWHVDDRATAELMDLFYEALLDQGLGPAEAVRRAQLELPLREERWSAPYFWAGFVLQGDWRWPAEDHDRP